MSRKFIYLVVIITTIGLVLYSDYHQKEIINNSLSNKDENSEIVITDSYNSLEIPSSLTIKNFQNDDEEIIYTYQLSLSDISGAYLYEYNDKENYLVFSANGQAQITLKSNESITIYDLPNNTNYKITQVNDLSNKYTTTANNENKTSLEGTISYDTTITFENKTIVDKTESTKNPYTYSKPIIIFIIMCVLSISIYKIIKNINIKRYE